MKKNKCVSQLPSQDEIKSAIGGFAGEKFLLKKAHDPKDIDKYWKPLPTPQPGDWLYEQPEQGQDYNQFAAGKRAILGQDGDTIRILPIKYNENSLITTKLLKDIQKFIKAFYYGCKVELLKPIFEKDIIQSQKVNFNQETKQYNALDICKFVHYKFGNKKTIAINAFTEFDLGIEYLNFLFGLACPATHCGCSSIHRQVPQFTGEQFISEEDEYNCILIRACKVMTHEIGHMFGLLHCIYYHCAMNGSNDLQYTDSRPLYFCAVCYRKLGLCLDMDHVKRYSKLVKVCEEFGGRFEDGKNWFQIRHDDMKKKLEGLQKKT